MNVKSAKFYQAIAIAQKTLTHINMDPKQAVFWSSCSTELVPNFGLRIDVITAQGAADSVLVPFNNLAYVQLHPEVKAAEEKPKKKA